MTTAIPQDFFPQRVRLLMSYNPSLTLSEQSVAGAPNQGQLSPNQTAKGEKSEDNFFEIETPNQKVMRVPSGTKILQYADYEYYASLATSDNISSLVDKKKGGKGNSETDRWVPSSTEWSKIIAPNSVVTFETPEGDRYKAIYEHPTMEEIFKKGNNTAESFYSELLKKNPEPLRWRFEGYISKSGKFYVPPKEPWYVSAWETIKNNWEIIAIVAVQFVIGALTLGMSLPVQAAIFLAVDAVLAGVEYWRTGDPLGSAIIFAVGLVPFIGRLSKFGVKDVGKFLKKFGPELSKVKTKTELNTLFSVMNESEKLLLTRAFSQTPGEFKKAAGKVVYQSMYQAVKDGKITLSKIPFNQLLWVKQVFIEGGIQLGVGFGLQVARTIYEIQKLLKDVKQKQIKIESPETKTLEEVKELAKQDSIQRGLGKYDTRAVDSIITSLHGADTITPLRKIDTKLPSKNKKPNPFY